MKVQFYKTRNKFLKSLLEGYYFLVKDDVENDLEYITFPNNLISISVYKNAQVNLNDHVARISETGTGDLTSVLVSGYKVPIQVIYEGNIDEITFCFKPLGINSVLNEPGHFFGKQINDFYPFDDYIDFIRSLFVENEVESKIEMIESYWLSKINSCKNPVLTAIIDDIVSSNEEVSIAKLGQKYQMSRQNINYLFKKYLGKPPKDFIKIHRFRCTLANRINTLKVSRKLISLSYESLFYDQSHMIKEFRSLTGLSPKDFFAKVQLREGAGSWLFD